LHAPLRVFHVPRVEARLYKPLELGTGDVATHYFRDYRVLAEDGKQAKELVIQDLAGDGAAFVRWDGAEASEVPDSDEAPSILDRGGRVYFAG